MKEMAGRVDQVIQYLPARKGRRKKKSVCYKLVKSFIITCFIVPLGLEFLLTRYWVKFK
jgi:t-SNARE complex subunit (syntaxin)